MAPSYMFDGANDAFFAKLFGKVNARKGPPRTSVTDPIRVAWVPLPVRGRLGVTFAPGKKDNASKSKPGAPWDRDLKIDLSDLVKAGVDSLVCLLEDRELDTLKIRALPTLAPQFGIDFAHFPIKDMSFPTNGGDAVDLAGKVLECLRAGSNVVFHCRGGLGRAGMMAALTLIQASPVADLAMFRVRSVRPGAIETKGQEMFLERMAGILRGIK